MAQGPDHSRTKALRRTRYTAVFVTLAAAFVVMILLNINTGSVNIPVGRILKILFLRQGDANEVSIIWKIRMPRILQSAVLGGALALSGFLLQTFFGNPIAGPFVLGISSGAKMCVAIVMILLIGRFGAASSWALILAAFAGAMLSTAFILAVSRAVRHMAALLVAGIMIGYICSAVTEFLVTFAEDSDIVNLHGWSQGSFSGADWSGTGLAALIVGLSFAFVFLLAKPIGAYQMGEAYAQSMGVNIRRFRVQLIILSGVLSACVTAFAGPVSFVGIAVPFLVKRALGTSKPLVVIPAAFLGGAVFCMVSDLIARTAFSPTELNISTVTSVLGAPIVIYMLIRRSR
ncbi:MAG: iron ABC transporter permease [Lachnospiraceae bacterium]|nr:iron ABC transporter permease [Lachnospiraceae bacterium]MBQ9034180.1 iron ABC transporter permease [Lachnospiraceae bacterium]MBQ9049497.1 iron ABC transporter permease [Lachnospiraceae bacterium]